MPKPAPNEKPNASGEIQSEFDGLYGVPRRIQNLTPQQVATELGVTDQTVRNYIDEGLLCVANISPNPAGASREHVRIARFSVVALWRERQFEKNGCELPFYQSPEVQWWRGELRKKQIPK